tara:strand:+ start:85 stop:600 length:516 start_codon:yes stop_codon:yes gene_type:complete
MTILENFLKSKKAQKIINSKPGEEGFSLVELVVVIAVLAILSAVAIPAFVGVRSNARASAVKNALVNGIKECVVRDSDDEDTAFALAQSFANVNAFQGYTLSEGADATCFSALATADAGSGLSNFSIEMNTQNGVVTKECSDVNGAGCNGGETMGTDANGDPIVLSTVGTW